MTHEPGAARASHREAFDALPWYVNGTLDPQAAARVRLHAGGCVACRAELEALERFAAAVRAGDDVAVSMDAAWERMAARLDASSGAAAAGTPRPGGRVPWRRWLRLAGRPAVLRPLAVAEAAAVLLLAGALLWPFKSSFETRSREAVPAAAPVVRLWVVFSPEAPEAALREALLAAGARIVAGPAEMQVGPDPSRAGLYTVEVAVAAGQGSDPDEAIERLRRSPVVRLALPAGTPRG